MISLKYYNQKINSVSLLMDRQYGAIDRYVHRRLHCSQSFIDHLEQEAVLKGHGGCVNCLEWSSDGRVLASGSDDLQVILWDPFRKRQLYNMRSKHSGNMFSVKFLPKHNDSLLATGAADKYIYVFDVNRYNEAIICCSCHCARVKRLATAIDSPFVFWSAGEDGVILQLDLREKHRCRSDNSRVLLINLTTCLHANVEAKCLAVNPRRTELLAVGANDPYARIYDRRMLRLNSTHTPKEWEWNENSINSGVTASLVDYSIPQNCVTYFCPGHINKNNSRIVEHESRAITYLTFNAAGTELLVNMGGDHIYLYDLHNSEQPVYLSLPKYRSPLNAATSATNHQNSVDNAAAHCGDNIGSIVSNRQKLPEHIEVYKKMGNEFLENEKYLRAIDQYSQAISVYPDCPVLYLNRATAYMRRLWYGDIYAALKDCQQALRLDPSYIKAHFRLARALLELGHHKEADECLKELINRFPTYADNHGVMMLRKDIKENRQSSLQSQQQSIEVYNCLELSDEEYLWRCKAKDYSKRFVGHCNTTTDIKEANYFGYDGEFIVAGSDDGNFFIWERATSKIRSVHKADAAIVNCVQPHPEICLMATSGIDHDVKLWSPMSDSSEKARNITSYIDDSVQANQQKMRTDPFDLNSQNYLCRNS